MLSDRGRPDAEDHGARLHPYKMFRIRPQADGKWMGGHPGRRRCGEEGEFCLRGDGFHFVPWKCSGIRKRWESNNIVNVLNATESFTLNGYNSTFVVYVCFTIIMVIMS